MNPGCRAVPAYRLPFMLFGLGFVLAGSLHAQVTFNATGSGNTYEVISSALGGTPYEVPDCAHTDGFGRHITDAWDAVLGKYVFVFHLHVVPDGDLCVAVDRQRNEIKTYGPSYSYVKGFYGDFCSYRWKFKLDAGFQPSPNFTHIHQIKAGDGSDAGSPLITITPRYASPNRLEIIYTAPSGLSGSTKVTTPLANFTGQWIEAHERTLYASNGTYELTLRRVSDGAVLLGYTNNNLNMWRGDATFNRPKWGIYRSLLSSNYLRDEQVRFADFCLAKGGDSCPSTIGGALPFTLTAIPSAQSVAPGSNTTFSVSLTTNSPLANSVVFRVTGLPANATADFNPAAMITNGSSTLTISTTASTPLGSCPLTITGTNNVGTNSAAVTLIVATNQGVQPGGLVARLNFDDGTGFDSSGHGNHGTLLNGASVVNDVDRGKVLDLDGVNDYVDLGNGSSLNLSDNNQATITAWVKMAATQNHNTILSKGEWKDAYSLLIKGDSTPNNLLWTGNDTSVFSGAPIVANTWTHVAVVINGDLTTFYINGQVSGTANQDRGNAIDNTGTGVSIGREQYSGSLPAGRWFFNGRLDDVRIYEVALNQLQVQAVMAAPANSAPAFAGDLLTKSAAVAGETYDDSIGGDASDPNADDTLTFSKISGPGWLNVSGDGSLSGAPGSGDVGTNSFVVRVTDSGNLFDEATLMITVNAAPDFTITAMPPVQSTVAGSHVSFTVTVTATNGFADDVNLGLSGFPAGISYGFDQSTLGGAGVSTMTVTVSNDVSPGDYVLTVSGTSGSLTHNARVTLRVIDARLRIAAMSVVGSDLVLSGSNGVSEGTFYLLTSTNIALPRSNWTVLATNAFDSAGNFNITNSTGLTNRRQFFQIRVP